MMKSVVLVLSLVLLAIRSHGAVALPGKIEAEAWDRFQDNASQPGTQQTNDAGGGLNVGWIEPGEWLEYDVTVAEEGDFRLALRVSSASGATKTVRVAVDDVETSRPVEFTRGDGWQSWFEVGLAPVHIADGNHRVRITFETGGLNLNWIRLAAYQPVVPGSPGPVRVTDATTTQVRLEWFDPVDDESGFRIYLSTDDVKPAQPLVTLPADTTTHQLDGLPQGARHRVWVEAVNAAGAGEAAFTDFTTLSTSAPAVVQVGAGSYAEFPPYDEGNDPGMFQNFALNTPLNVADGETRPIPTNDWWTHLLLNDSNTSLWSYPQVTRTTASGFRVHAPHLYNAEGSTIQYGAYIQVSTDEFAPRRFVAENWSDWALDVCAESSGRKIRATVAHGIPFDWFRFENAQPVISFSAASQFADANGNPVVFPVTTSCLRVSMDGSWFGLHFPTNVVVLEQDGTLRPDCDWLAVSVLPDGSSLAAFQPYSLNRPKSTQVAWNLDAEHSTLEATWSVTTEAPDGTPGGDTLQGFLVHHRAAGAQAGFPFSPYVYQNTTRGTLTLAGGRTFAFEYPWKGFVGHYPVPSDTEGEAPWRPQWMEQIITDYAATADYGTDTYWGGKGLVMLGKYLLLARDTHHPAYPAIKEKLRHALSDWLTYTPGETSRYYAAYPRWGALVGFDESYYSYQFTDHHFHYGYLIHAAALMAQDDPQWVAPYADILRMVAKEYANWDRTDQRFPFMRTFDPWMGHSYAGGTGSPGGNNQESTSEALQAWAGMFLLGSTLGDDAMRDAGAFGYLQESQATMEYWFNRSGSNWPQAYAAGHDVVGILWNDGFAYGTFFSAAPQHIYGIQWLPVMPAFRHLVDGVSRSWSDHLYQGLGDRILTFYQSEGDPIASDGVVTLQEIGRDWGNALLGYRLFAAPDEVAGVLEGYGASADSGVRQTLFSPEGGLNYYYCHAHRTLGAFASDQRLSIPTSTVFADPSTGSHTYLVFNPDSSEAVCRVADASGQAIGEFVVPAGATVAHHLDSHLDRMEVSAPRKHLTLNESMDFTVKGYDQYGATFPLTDTVIRADSGGVMTPGGRFTALSRKDKVTVTATQDGYEGTFTLRIGDAPRLASVSIIPGFARVEVNSEELFSAVAKDQYGDPYPVGSAIWSANSGTIDANGRFHAPDLVGSAGIHLSLDGKTAEAVALVSAAAENLALGKPVQASSVGAGNLASRAVDGNTGSRWESAQGVDPQTFEVDLGKLCDLKQVEIEWETAAAADYTIEVSNNGVDWKQVHERTGAPYGARRIDSIELTGTSARHFRITGTRRTTQYGYSIWELRVFGYPNVTETEPTSMILVPSQNELLPGGTADVRAFAWNDAGEGGEVDAQWSADAATIDAGGNLVAGADPGVLMVAADYGGLHAEVSLNIAEVSIYQSLRQWLSDRMTGGHAGDPAFIGLTADPDLDGLPNFAEFYLRKDPLTGDGRSALVVDSTGELVLYRNPDALSEISLDFESSSNLLAWSPWVPEPAETPTANEVRLKAEPGHRARFYRAVISLR